MGSAYAIIYPTSPFLSEHCPSAPDLTAEEEKEGLQQPHQLTQLHDSVLTKLLAQLDTRSKCALLCTCKQAQQLVSRQEHWRELAFDTANEQHGLEPSVLFSLLRRSEGSCQVLQLARWARGDMRTQCCLT